MDEHTFNVSVTTFLDNLASGSPAPGGRGAAALGGAMAAALVSMVCRLTIGTPPDANVEAEVRDTLDRAEALRLELQELAAADMTAFNRLSASYELPRTTASDTAIRRDAIQTSLRGAAEVPLRIARAAAAILPLCPSVAERGNQNTVADVGVAALLAQAAVRGALLNVDINLRALEDRIYVRQVRAEVERLTDGLQSETERVMERVNSKINM